MVMLPHQHDVIFKFFLENSKLLVIVLSSHFFTLLHSLEMAFFEKLWLGIPNCTKCTEIQIRQNLGAEVQKINQNYFFFKLVKIKNLPQKNIYQPVKVSSTLHF